MVPDSHMNGIVKHHDRFGEDNILTRSKTFEGIDEDTAVSRELKYGQMSLHHFITIHSSLSKQSSNRRIGIALQSKIPVFGVSNPG